MQRLITKSSTKKERRRYKTDLYSLFAFIKDDVLVKNRRLRYNHGKEIMTLPPDQTNTTRKILMSQSSVTVGTVNNCRLRE